MRYILTILYIFSTLQLVAQVIYPGETTVNDTIDQSVNISNEWIFDESFDMAIPMYEKLLEFAPESSSLNYKMGFCYLHSIVEKGKAIAYLEKAIQNMGKDPEDDAPIDAYFYLGRSYRVNARYNDAIKVLTALKSQLPLEQEEFIQKIDDELTICNNALAEQKSPQNKNQVKKQANIADEYINNENFQDAMLLYKELLIESPSNSLWNYKLGFCYLNGELNKTQALAYLQKAVDNISDDKTLKKQNAPLESYFYLGKAYQLNYRYNEALVVFNYMLSKLPAKDRDVIATVQQEIINCTSVIELIENPIDIEIKNLGGVVNSAYSDHSPVISADESVLIFTSRREGSSGGNKDDDGQYFEDIYVSYCDTNGVWQEPHSIGDNINTKYHEATIGLSPDGQELFVYKDDDDGSIYTSLLVGDKWSPLRKLGSNVNTKSRETHASVSADGNSLYFTSDRKDGYGGLDIYISHRTANGDWGEAYNLGPEINTPLDEESPYIHPDGVTLYFSSQGHKSIGEFDIFTSTYNLGDGSWSEPINIGFPINTSENDVFYVPTPDGIRAYYVSEQDDGYGAADIYLITLEEATETPLTIMTGVVSICTGVLPEIEIVVSDSATWETYGSFRVNQVTGKYLYVLTRGRTYKIEYLANQKVIYEETILIPEDSPYQEIYKGVRIKSGTPCDDEKYTTSVDVNTFDNNVGFLQDGKVYDVKLEIQSILFEFDQANQIPQNNDLDDLSKYLVQNKDAIVEIGAHADERGTDYYNVNLTRLRANVVRDYLIGKGVNQNQLVAIGYGERYPVAINKNPDGTWNEEAQKYNRRIEFKVVKQGEKSLLITPIRDIPERFKID